MHKNSRFESTFLHKIDQRWSLPIRTKTIISYELYRLKGRTFLPTFYFHVLLFKHRLQKDILLLEKGH
jgi:hypothetical protein